MKSFTLFMYFLIFLAFIDLVHKFGDFIMTDMFQLATKGFSLDFPFKSFNSSLFSSIYWRAHV